MRSLFVIFLLSVVSLQGAAFGLGAELPIPGTNYGPSAGGRYPLVTAAPSGFLATWMDQRHLPYELRAARIGADGTNREYTGITLDTCDGAGSMCTNVSSTFADGRFFVAWARDGIPKVGAVSENDGSFEVTLLDRGPYTAPSFYKPALAWTGKELVVVFDSGHRLYAAYVDANLHTTGIVPIPGGSGQGEQAVATDGSELFVAWDDLQQDRNEIWFSRLTLSGQPLDSAGIRLSSEDASATFPGRPISLDVVWSGEDFAIGFGSPNLTIARIAVDGGISRIDRSLSLGTVLSLRLTRHGRSILAFWNEPGLHSAEFDASGRQVDSAIFGPISRGIVVSGSGACNDTECLVALNSPIDILLHFTLFPFVSDHQET